MIAEAYEFQLGLYTVRVRPRPDSPGWPVYIVYRGMLLIGKSFSRPDEGCCRWIETSNGAYAAPSGPPRRHTLNGKNGHPRS
jgi:hypothetical protein